MHSGSNRFDAIFNYLKYYTLREYKDLTEEQALNFTL